MSKETMQAGSIYYGKENPEKGANARNWELINDRKIVKKGVRTFNLPNRKQMEESSFFDGLVPDSFIGFHYWLCTDDYTYDTND